MEKEILDSFPETKGCDIKRDPRNSPVTILEKRRDIAVLCFPKLKSCKEIDHFVSTRAGGVSNGQFATMNYSRSLGDLPENVAENYLRTAAALDTTPRLITGTVQTHTTNIMRVSNEHCGMVVNREASYTDIDGLITNEAGLTLAAYGADCTVLLFADPVRHAIGIAHSGWRGTAAGMAGKMVRRMQDEFGSDPKDLIAAIGPSICQSCYEVDAPLKAAFDKTFGDTSKERHLINDSGCYPMKGKNGLKELFEEGCKPGKYQLDLWLANLILLLRSGMELSNIDITDICTAHNPWLLFSHRKSAGKRGVNGAFIRLRMSF